MTAVPELRGIYAGLGELSALIQHQATAVKHQTNDTDESRDRATLSRELKKVEASLTDRRTSKTEHLESELDELRAALSLNRATKHLASIDHELAGLENKRTQHDSEAGIRNSLDRVVGKIDDCRLQLQQLKEEYNDIRRQTKELSGGRRGAKSISQIEAMLLHEKSLIKEEEAVEQLKLQIQDVENKIEAERQTVSPAVTDFSRMSDTQMRARLDALAERLRDAERDLEVAEQVHMKAEFAPAPASSLNANAPRPEDAVLLHEAEQQVLRLRERLGLDDQMGRLEAERSELLVQIRRLYRNQLLPFPIVMALGVPFMVGVAMVIYGLFMTGGVTNWQLVLLGMAISLFTALVKMSMDRGSSEMLDTTRRRIARVDHQIEQFAGARGDTESAGALQHELDVAERRLTELQAKFVPVTSQHGFPEHGGSPSLETAQLQLNNAQQRLHDMRRDWQDTLLQMGLPTTLTPSKAREAVADQAILAARSAAGNQFDQLNTQLGQLQHELDRRQDWLNVLGSQARQLVKEMGFSSGSGSMPEQFDALRHAPARVARGFHHEKQLLRNLKRVRQKRDQLKENGRRSAEQHRRLVEELKLKRERGRAQDLLSNERAKLLQEQRERLEREIDEIRERYRLESHSTHADLSDDELEQRLQSQADKLEKLRAKLLKQSEQRGRIRALLSSDAPQTTDNSTAVFLALQQRTEQLASQLKDTAKQAELAAQAQTKSLSHRYQPEYLQRAGDYLSDLSAGDFGRIELLETEPGLGLVNQGGQLIPLDHVDRQHYANLYFSLWLARLESFVDRGYQLPAVVEDPLLATKRARRPVVAELLHDFGMRGRQIILVTSKASSADLYGRLGAPVADLSDRQILDAESPLTGSNGMHNEQDPRERKRRDQASFSQLG